MNIVEKTNYYLILKIVNTYAFNFEEIGNLAHKIFWDEDIEKLIKEGRKLG